MAVRIRLKRFGAKRRPFYRIVVMDSRAPREGRAIEEIGHYNAVVHDEKQIYIARERLEYWLARGAQMSRTVSDLARRERLSPASDALNDEPDVDAEADTADAELHGEQEVDGE